MNLPCSCILACHGPKKLNSTANHSSPEPDFASLQKKFQPAPRPTFGSAQNVQPRPSPAPPVSPFTASSSATTRSLVPGSGSASHTVPTTPHGTSQRDTFTFATPSHGRSSSVSNAAPTSTTRAVKKRPAIFEEEEVAPNLEQVFRLNKGKQPPPLPFRTGSVVNPGRPGPSVAPGSSRRPRLSMERDLDRMVVELEDQKAKNVECDRALDEMKDYYNGELAKLRALVKGLESALVRESQRITDYIQHTLETRSNTPGGVPDGSVAAAST
ncbi:hypothetical protein BDV93DRAFT_560857 [Ceratobasidium sp. AG-I]|nr:hypothetical protein BDV93DRAFT_560857 [Ceratobasidium sp. AG-I]